MGVTMATVCDKCGAQTEVPESFIRLRKSFRRSYYWWCPSCHTKVNLQRHRRSIAWSLLYGVVGILLLFLMPGMNLGNIMINLFLFNLFLFASVLPHELGHAFMAKWVGFRVFKIIVGYGRTLFKTKVFGIPAEFLTLPVGGFAFASPVDRQWFRLKYFLVVFAGPFTNFLMCAGVLFFLPPTSVFNASFLSEGIAPGVVLFYSNLIVLIVNLWPHSSTTPMGVQPNDGKQLLQIIFSGKEFTDQAMAGRYQMETFVCMESREYDEALVWADEGLEKFPDNINLMNLRGISLLENQRFEDARACFISFLSVDEMTPIERSLMQNNVAYVNCFIGEHLYEEADKYSQEAISVLEWLPAVKGTRGAVLLKLKRYEDAVPLLLSAMAESENKGHKAQSACFLAIAETRLGHLENGRKYFDEARKLDPDCFLLDEVEKELAK